MQKNGVCYMKKHRIRPTALIVKDDQLLLIEYNENGRIYYNLPGGGLKKGETLIEGLLREVKEEACVSVDVGDIAFVYEYHPDHQSGDYDEDRPSLHLIFVCTLPEGETPTLPSTPDPLQTAVRWMPLKQLSSIELYPNMANHLLAIWEAERTVPLLEDRLLAAYSKVTKEP